MTLLAPVENQSETGDTLPPCMYCRLLFIPRRLKVPSLSKSMTLTCPDTVATSCHLSLAKRSMAYCLQLYQFVIRLLPSMAYSTAYT